MDDIRMFRIADAIADRLFLESEHHLGEAMVMDDKEHYMRVIESMGSLTVIGVCGLSEFTLVFDEDASDDWIVDSAMTMWFCAMCVDERTVF